MRKSTVYTLLQVGWGVLVLGTFVALYSGNAEFIASQSELPRPLWKAGAAAVGIAAAGWAVVAHRKSSAWRAMGRRLDLSVDSGGLGLFGTPDLRGTVQGRPVRVSTYTKTSGSGESRSSTTYTLVEANLDEHVENGVIVGRDDSGGTTTDDFEGMPVEKVSLDGGFVAIGATEGIADEILTTRVRNALSGPRELGMVSVGNAVDTMMDAIPNTGGVFGWIAERASAANPAGDSSTVSNKTRGVLLDPDEVQRRLDAVVAVADAYEDATS